MNQTQNSSSSSSSSLLPSSSLHSLSPSSCELCSLEAKTHWYPENNPTLPFVLLECSSCSLPMAVWRTHSPSIPLSSAVSMLSSLCSVADRVLGKGEYFIDRHQRTIGDHLHWHARPSQTWVFMALAAHYGKRGEGTAEVFPPIVNDDLEVKCVSQTNSTPSSVPHPSVSPLPHPPSSRSIFRSTLILLEKYFSIHLPSQIFLSLSSRLTSSRSHPVSMYLAMITDSASLDTLFSLSQFSLSIKSVRKSWILMDVLRYPHEKNDELECEILLLSYNSTSLSPKGFSSQICPLSEDLVSAFSSLKGKRTLFSPESLIVNSL
jgi:hypothetical protein